MALVSHPRRGLSNLPGQDGARHRATGVPRPRVHRLQSEPYGELSHARVLCPIPRDGLQLRQPFAGRRGYLLLLRARERQTHDGPGGFQERPRDLPRLRDLPPSIPGPGDRGGRLRLRLGGGAGGAAGHRFTQRFRFREAQQGAHGQSQHLPAARRAELRGVRLPRSLRGVQRRRGLRAQTRRGIAGPPRASPRSNAVERAGRRLPVQAGTSHARRPEPGVLGDLLAHQGRRGTRPRHGWDATRTVRPVRIPGASLGRALPRRPTHPPPHGQGAPDGHGGGSHRRGNLHGQVRAREGPVPLGPPRPGRREQLLLAARGAIHRGQDLGWHSVAARGPGGDRGLSGGRPGPAHRRRPRVQWGGDAALRVAGQQDHLDPQVQLHQGRQGL